MESIIHSEDWCFICGGYATDTHHCIHGTANRKLADQDGLTVRLCHTCHMKLHDKGSWDKDLQSYAQIKWMEHNNASVEDFIKRYGKSYL